MTAAVDRLRVVHVGAGAMGREWLRVEAASPDVEVVGVVDLDAATARAGAALVGSDGVATGSDLADLLARTAPDAVVDATVPVAHHPVTTHALFAGLPVLGEKPAAATLAEALSLAAAAEVTGRLFMVSQSRRYDRRAVAFGRRIDELGGAAILDCQFFRAPRFGGFREQMDDVLLLDMAIHPFDLARRLMTADPIAVVCESYNPDWSWYRGDAAASALFEFPGGRRFVYTGSWCSPGAETSWNGSWRASTRVGTALWDGETMPLVDTAVEDGVPAPTPLAVEAPDAPEGLAGALAAFVEAVRTGRPPDGEIHRNLASLVMVEAALRSKTLRRRVLLDEVLATAYDRALADETTPEVREVLRGWGSAGAALRHPDDRGTAAPQPERKR